MVSWRGLGRWVWKRQNAEAGCVVNPVIDPELDMERRYDNGSHVLVAHLMRLKDWLVPAVERVGSPMRSVDRELHESWPSSEH